MFLINPYIFVQSSYVPPTGSTYVLVQQNLRNDDLAQFTTNNYQYVGSSFTASATYDVRRIRVDMCKTGSPVTVLNQLILTNNPSTGLPDVGLWESETFISASSVTTINPTTSSYNFDYPAGCTLTSGSIYHIVTYADLNRHPAAIGTLTPPNTLYVGIGYADSPGQKLSRDTDGSGFTLIYNNTAMHFKSYKIE